MILWLKNAQVLKPERNVWAEPGCDRIIPYCQTILQVRLNSAPLGIFLPEVGALLLSFGAEMGKGAWHRVPPPYKSIFLTEP